MRLLIFLVIALGLTFSNGAVTKQQDTEWWKTAIFYQIYPRSFMDSDGNGVGDLKGIISKLEHLKDLGVGATWLSPIFKSPMVDFGYDIASFTQIDEIFGDNDDFVALVNRAKELGIKIIMDFVPNHTSNKHDWFIKSELKEEDYDDYYMWVNAAGLDVNNDPIPPNNWQSVFYGSAWEWSIIREQFYLHQFDKSQPDLNFRNPKVVEELKNVLRFWLDNGVSGFRVDAINHLFEVEDLRDEPINNPEDPNSYGYTHHYYTKDLDETYDMIYQWREVLDNYTLTNGGEDRIMLTEAYANLTYTMRYYQSDDGSRKGCHFPFNFILMENIHWDTNALRYKEIIDSWMGEMTNGRVANWVLGNHDKSRVGSRYNEDKIDALMALVLTLPGVAVTYNGEEIGMLDNWDMTLEDMKDPQACNSNNFWASRDPFRTPFQWDNTTNAGFSTGTPWLPLHSNYVIRNLQAQKSADKSYYKFYKSLSTLRAEPTMQNGNFKSYVFNSNVLSYIRTLEEHDTYIIVMNLGINEEIIDLTKIDIQIGSELEVVTAGSKSLYNAGDKHNSSEFIMAKYDVVILKNIINDKGSANVLIHLSIYTCFAAILSYITF